MEKNQIKLRFRLVAQAKPLFTIVICNMIYNRFDLISCKLIVPFI